MKQEDSRFKNLNLKIGIFIAIALAGIAIAVVLFGLQKDLFTKKYSLHFTVDRGTGFAKGMPIKLSGFRIGRVTSINLNDQAMVDITVEIDNKYRKWIRNDSVVKLVKEGLVGDNIVEVSVGSLDKQELKDNEAITYVKTKGLDELADEIADRVKPVLIEIRDIISYINNPEGDLKKSIRNMELLTRNLEGSRKNVDTLITSTSGNIDRLTTHATTVLHTANNKIEAIDLTSTINNVNSSIEKLDTKLPSLLGKLEITLDNMKQISNDTKNLTEIAFPKIPGLLSQAEDVMLSADKLVNSIQNSWLLRDSIPVDSGTSYIKRDSHE